MPDDQGCVVWAVHALQPALLPGLQSQAAPLPLCKQWCSCAASRHACCFGLHRLCGLCTAPCAAMCCSHAPIALQAVLGPKLRTVPLHALQGVLHTVLQIAAATVLSLINGVVASPYAFGPLATTYHALFTSTVPPQVPVLFWMRALAAAGMGCGIVLRSHRLVAALGE